MLSGNKERKEMKNDCLTIYLAGAMSNISYEK